MAMSHWRKRSLLSCSWSLWQEALLCGAYSEVLRSQSHPQEMGMSLKNSFHLELPKSWVFLGAKPCFQKVILSPGCANPEHLELMSSSVGTEKGPQDGPQSSLGALELQGLRSFLRSLCPNWDPLWAAFTRPLNCPCSFTFFLRLSLVLLRGM